MIDNSKRCVRKDEYSFLLYLYVPLRKAMIVTIRMLLGYPLFFNYHLKHFVVGSNDFKTTGKCLFFSLSNKITFRVKGCEWTHKRMKIE